MQRNNKIGTMESKNCGVNHLDADVLLPPRKRLLAGFKKQSTESDTMLLLYSCSPSPPSPPSSSSYSSSSDCFKTRLSSLLSFHSNSNLPPDGIVEASRSAATVAVKTAKAARAAAEEKAAIAAKAVAAAKTALDLLASISDEAVTHGRNLKKNKLKKQLPLQLLYRKYQPIENCETDEELARKLHRAINSSPRILHSSPSNDSKGRKNKKPRTCSESEKSRMSNGQAQVDEAESKSHEKEVFSFNASQKASVCENSEHSGLDNEAATSQSKERNCEDIGAKSKEPPLTICSFSDQATHRKEMNMVASKSTEKTMGQPGSDSGTAFSADTPTDGCTNSGYIKVEMPGFQSSTLCLT